MVRIVSGDHGATHDEGLESAMPPSPVGFGIPKSHRAGGRVLRLAEVRVLFCRSASTLNDKLEVNLYYCARIGRTALMHRKG